MIPRLNTTGDYHRNELETLGWELTVCNSLEPENSPCREILRRNASYGQLLFEFLSSRLPLTTMTHILEIGGGYGYLMRDFLSREHSFRPTMLDISPFLLSKQQETLGDLKLSFIEQDFMETRGTFLEQFELVILNENLGDFPTLCGISHEDIISSTEPENALLREARTVISAYDLALPDIDIFNLNIGPIRVLEKLCAAGVSAIFLAEHSCEAIVPSQYRNLIQDTASGNPEKISLRGHDEYTIAFSHLESVAKQHGYEIYRGLMLDYIPVNFSPDIHFLMTSRVERNDRDEIIRQFIDDLFLYEYLVIFKKKILTK